jgi:hypothetical protein
MGRTCSMHGRYDKCIQILVRKHEGKKLFINPGHNRKDRVQYQNRYRRNRV